MWKTIWRIEPKTRIRYSCFVFDNLEEKLRVLVSFTCQKIIGIKWRYPVYIVGEGNLYTATKYLNR